MSGLTGIYIRAVGKDGHIGPYDLAELDFDSLTAWLKRDGGDNLLAENTVRCLLGHEQLAARQSKGTDNQRGEEL